MTDHAARANKGYDPECLKLADYFLQDNPYHGTREELAQRLQDAVEDYFSDCETEYNYERDR